MMRSLSLVVRRIPVNIKQYPFFISSRSYTNKTASEDGFDSSILSEDSEEVQQDIKSSSSSPLKKLNANQYLVHYERALEMQELGEDFLKNDEFDRAVGAFQSSLSTLKMYCDFKFGNNSNHAERAEILIEPANGLAFSLQSLGRFTEAMDTYKQVFEYMNLVPRSKELNARVKLNYAEMLCVNGDHQDAIDTIKDSIKDLDNGETRALGLLNIGTFYAVMKDPESGIPFAKEGYELFSKLFGKNNAYTERALGNYTRILRDANKEDEAMDVEDEWNDTKHLPELKAKTNEKNLDGIITETLKHFSQKNVFDPRGIIVPPEFLKEQQEEFREEYSKLGLGDSESLSLFFEESKALDEVIESSKEYYKQSKRPEEEAENFREVFKDYTVDQHYPNEYRYYEDAKAIEKSTGL